MAGMATNLAFNVYPAHFAQISHNMLTQAGMAAQGFNESEVRKALERRQHSVDAEYFKPEADRDADGHAWGPPRRRKRGKNQGHDLERLAGEGSLFDSNV